jgi:hypothetical protein
MILKKERWSKLPTFTVPVPVGAGYPDPVVDLLFIFNAHKKKCA